MEEGPECPVCFEGYTEPVMLSCGHVLCWPCLHLKRNSLTDNANLCPRCNCQYIRASPVFLSDTLTMTNTDLSSFGPRIERDFSPPPTLTPPPASPPVSPRRSLRAGRGTPGNRFLDFVVDQALAPGHQGSAGGRGGGRARGARGARRARGTRGRGRMTDSYQARRDRGGQYMDSSSDDESATVNEEETATVNISPPHEATMDFSLPQPAAGHTPAHLDVTGDNRVSPLNSGDEGTSNDMNQPKRYFKTYSIIPGTQTTHDFAILQVVLDHMTLHQKRRIQLNMTQICREVREKFGQQAFLDLTHRDCAKHVKRSLEKSVKSFKLRLAASSGSGQTAPPQSTQDDLISQILALDDSLRLNGPRVDHPVPVNAERTAPQPAARILTSEERTETESDLALNSPIVVNRRRLGPDNGRELRESSLAAHSRRPRQGHPRLESSLSELVGAASQARSSSNDVSVTMSNQSEDRQFFRERKYEEDMRQRELDRMEKQKDRDAARESSLLMAGVLSRLVHGVS